MHEVERVDDANELLRGSQYAYHLTGINDLPAVLADGLDPTRHLTDRREEHDFLHAVADHDGLSDIPSRRDDCVFLYATIEKATYVADGLSAEQLLVIDLGRVDAPLYQSNYGAFTRFINPEYQTLADARAAFDRQETDHPAWATVEAARAYWATVRPFDTLAGKSLVGIELLVDGWVPADAIVQHYAG
jgi:hypothetical protein